MDMYVYLDLVFLMNFAVDFLLLLGTNRFSGFGGSSWRCGWAAVLGGIYGSLCVIPGFWFLGTLLWRTVFLLLMGVVGFGLDRSALRRIPQFFILSMALGGLAAGTGKGVWAVLTGSGMLWFLCRMGFGSGAGGEYLPVELHWQDNSVKLYALRDTGNTLRDPLTGEQVMVCGADVGEELLGIPRHWFLDPAAAVATGKIPGSRLIPYHAVGNDGGMMLMVRLKEAVIGDHRRTPLVAFAPEEIGRGQVYRMLTGGRI